MAGPNETDGYAAPENLSQTAREQIDFVGLVDQAADGIVVSDPRTMTVIYANAAAGALMRCAPDDLLGMPITALIAPESLAALPVQRDVLDKGESASAERVFLRPDGSEFAGEIIARKMPSGTYAAIIRDVSDARKREDERRRGTEALGERVKELQCLYAVSRTLAAAHEVGALRAVVEQIPPGWQFPDITAARITIGGETFQTRGFAPTPWCQRAPIRAGGAELGALDVVYTRERLGANGEVFLAEEWDLIGGLAERIGEAISRIQLRQALAEREAYYRAMVDNVSDVFSIQGADGRVAFVSPSVRQILGYEPSERIGRRTQELIHPDDLSATLATLGKIRDTPGNEGTVEIRMRHKDGHWRVLEARGRNLLDDPQIRGIVMVARDITDRRRAEDALRDSEHRHRKLVENIADIITIVSPDGKIVRTNPAHRRTLGEFDDYRRSNVFALSTVHPEDLPAARAALKNVLAQPDEAFEVRLRVPDETGAWRTLDCTARNLIDDPSIGGIVVTARDVTERTELEQQLRHAQKMEAIGRLAGGVAHDFNNILTAIGGFAALVRDGLDDGNPLRDDVREIERATEHAASLTRQLLTFSRRQVMAPRIVELAANVRDAHRLLSRLIGAHIELVMDLGEDAGKVRIDVAQLEQLVVNLAVNARDAMPDGGQLTLRTRRRVVEPGTSAAEASTMPSGPYAVLEVEDTGCGMNAETRDRAFEPFFTTKPVGQGTGLGLSTVFGVVAQSGGHIQCETEPGRGTTMRVFLPAVDVATPAEASDIADAHDSHEGSVLVVEDDPTLRRLVVRVLRRAGYEVREVEDGAVAFELLSTGATFDLILCDVNMPNLSGPRLATKLHDSGVNLPFLFMSGYAGDDLPAARDIAARDELLSKPFTPDALLSAVKQARNRR